MPLNFEDFLREAALVGGDPARLRALMLAVRRPEETAVLQRCAAVRSFDQRLYDEILRTDGAPSFEQWRERPETEPSPGQPGFIELRAPVRREFWDCWWEPDATHPSPDPTAVPDALRELARRLAAYYQALGPGARLERLRQLALCDPPAADELFVTLYADADRRFDLAACHNLVSLLDERNSLLGLSLRQRLNDRRLYLQARSRWVNEFYRSAPYYERRVLTDRIARWFGSPQRWVLHLFARGGLGKTAFIRWFIARYCVPDPRRIPCAHIDFDFFGPALLAQYPWLPFLKIAEQLNQQIPGAPFAELLNEHRQSLHILEHHELLHTRNVAQELSGAVPAAAGMEERILAVFTQVLTDAGQKLPVIIILDTLEEVVLDQDHDLMTLLRTLAKIRRDCPQLRLVLSGRYNLAERLDGFQAEFQAHCTTLRLEPFSAPEARRYLTHKRLIENQDIVDAAVRRAGGNPFKLSLFADILRARPGITAREVNEYPDDVELLYLIERVVERIPDNFVQWVLRYGALARRLTFRFFKDVMWEPMIEALRGNLALDDAQAGLGETLRGRGSLWRLDPDASRDDDERFVEAWKQLGNYASGYSWVTLGEDKESLDFHPEVTEPLRRAMEDQPVFARLHRHAVDYFERKSRDEPARWDRWMTQAVYHRFQLDGAAAGGYWREVIERPEARGNLHWRRELAREVVGTVLLDEDHHPRRRRNGQPSVDAATLVHAYYELARCNVDLVPEVKPEQQKRCWREAAQSLARAREQEAHLDGPVFPPVEVSRLQAAVLTSQGKYAEARELLHGVFAAHEEEGKPIPLALRLQHADLVIRLDRKEAHALFERILPLARQAERHEEELHVLQRLCSLDWDAANYVQAQRMGDAALVVALRGVAPAARAREAILQNIGLALALGQPARALATGVGVRLSSTVAFDGPDRYALCTWEAEAAFMLYQPDVALKLCARLFEKSDEIVLTNTGPLPTFRRDVPPPQRAALLEIYARTASGLHAHEHAALAIETARQLWTKLGLTDKANHCALRHARFLMDDVGDYRRATTHLRGYHDTAEKGVARAARARASRDLLLAECLVRRGMTREALWTLKPWQDTTISGSAFLQARVAQLGAMATAREGASTHARRLLTLLKPLEPASMRVVFTGPLQHSEPWELPDDLRRDLRALFPEVRADNPEFCWQALRMVEVRRVLGDPDGAWALLDAAEADFREKGQAYALRAALLARDRLTRDQGGAPVSPDDENRWVEQCQQAFAGYPALARAALIEQAARLLFHPDAVRAARVLETCVSRYGAPEGISRTAAQFFTCQGTLAARGGRRAEAAAWIEKAKESSLLLGDTPAATGLPQMVAEGPTHPPPLDRPDSVRPEGLRKVYPFLSFDQTMEVAHVALSPDGAELAVAAGTTVEVVEICSGGRITQILCRGANALAFGPDDSLVFTDADGLQIVKINHEDAPEVLARDFKTNAVISPDGRFLAATSGDTLTVWTLKTRQVLASTPRVPGIERVRFAPDGNSLWTQHDARVLRVWSLPDLSLRDVINRPDAISSWSFSPDGRWLAVVDEQGATVASLEDTAFRFAHPLPDASVIIFSADGRLLATSTGRGSVEIWSNGGHGPRLLGRVAEHGEPMLVPLAFSPDGQGLLTGDFAGATLWETDTGRARLRLQTGGPVHGAVFLPDGITVAIPDVRSVHLLNTAPLAKRFVNIRLKAAKDRRDLQVVTRVGFRRTSQQTTDFLAAMRSTQRYRSENETGIIVGEGWQKFGEELGRALDKTAAAVARLTGGTKRRFDAALSADDQRLAGLPWEWALPPSSRGEPLGVWRALNHLVRVGELPLPIPLPPETRWNVLILKPSSDHQRQRSRGHAYEGLDIERMYRRHGIYPHVINDPQLARLPQQLSEIPDVTVVHLCASMKFSPSLGCCLDLGGARPTLESSWQAENEADGTLSASALCSYFQPVLKRRPLVVLDIVRPHGTEETVRHLMLRNEFASELHLLGSTGAVLAAGLGGDGRQTAQSRALIQGLAQGREIGAVASGMRQLFRQGPPLSTGAWEDTSGLEAAVAFLGVALFADSGNAVFTSAPTE